MSPHTDPCTARIAGAPRPWRERVRGLLVAGLVVSLAACGGGGGGSNTGVGTGGTGSFAVGSISGFGSIIVNGVRYNDNGASVLDDDGNALSASDLGLGMTVEIRGSVGDDGVSGTAESVSTFAELKGPVTAVDAGAGTLTVFDQVVSVNAATVFDEVGGLAALAVGNVVEVYGLPGAGGTLTATRIEREAETIAAYSGDFRVRGAVAGLTGTSPDLRFTVSTVTVTTNAGTDIDGTLIDGAYVSVRLNTAVAVDGSYAAERVKVRTRSYDDDVDEAEIEGLVSDFTSLGAPFKVNGYAVRLDAAVTYDDGAAGDLANGVRVEVEGNVASGVLVVREVKFEDEDDDGGVDGSDAPFEFNGVATCSTTPCGSPSGTLVIRGEMVAYDESTEFDDGVTPESLNGANVEIHAVAEVTASGTTFRATRIELDN